MSRPGLRVGLGLLAAAVLGGLLVYGYGLLVRQLALQRLACQATPGNLVGGGCNLLLSYPNRLSVIIAGAVLLVVVVAGIAYLRWTLQPLRDLTEVVSRLGPTNLGYRLGWPRRRDTLGRLGNELDASMDRIAAGYENQRRFAANASHELRTPLAVQRTLIEVSLTEPPTPDQLSLISTQLLAANRRNERLVEGLLALSEAEQTPVGHTPLRLDVVARDVADQYRSRAQQAGIHLDVQGVPSTIDGEKVLVERLVTNLVQNALAYNHRDGRVGVGVEDRLLSVVNTGPVVAAEDVDGLFEPFRRGAGDRSANPDGAGLGLTIVRAVARVHQASVQAEPGPDGGLRVLVRFPSPR